jgi:AcrR family transcriptional regulator
MFDIPMRDRRAERHEATRAEILDAAWALVRTEGLAGLSLRDLARRVGMQAPSLYSYFDSKYAIYDAMFAQGVRAYLDREALVVSTGDPLADLQTGVRFFVTFCTEDPVRYQLMFQRTIPGFEPSEETFALAVEGLRRLETRLAAIGITDQRSLDLLTAIGTGITDQQISNDPGGDRWTRLVDEAIEMYFNHVSKATNKTKRKRQ